MLRHFALRDDALLVRMHELDRLLDRHDMPREVGVDVVHQRGQCRALAAAGRSGDQHQPPAQVPELLDHRRQAKLVEGGDARRDETENGAQPVHLLEIIATETAVRVHLVGEIEVALVLETLPIFRRADLAEHVVHFVRGKDLLADRDDVAVAADFRRLALGEVQVGRARVDQNLE